MGWFSTVFSLFIAAAGWYYLFYSRAAVGLHEIEDQNMNRRRQKLRHAGGLVMLLLAVALYAGFHSVDAATSAKAFLLVWMGVFLLLLAIMLLAIADLRLTWRLRHRRRP